MNIGIDIDDTISNTFESAIIYAKEYIKDELKREPKVDMSKVRDHYYIRDMFNLSNEEAENFWEKYYTKIIDNVEPKKLSVEMINKLKEEGNNIIIITARWNSEEIDAFKISEKWLKKYNFNFDKMYVGIENKAEIAVKENINLFIDDSIRNCEEVSAVGIKSYLFDSETNKHINQQDNIDRVYSWEEIYSKVSH